MRALILTEGGSQIGLGHISRCSSLYDELESRGIEVEFIISGDSSQFQILKNKKYKVINWLTIDFLDHYLNDRDFCIVDSYLASEDLYKIISNRVKNSVFIDDNGRIIYPQGTVVNPSLSTKAVKYPNNGTNCYLIGPRYIILRRPFIYGKRKTINTSVREVLITLGGSDIHNLTPIILNQLSKRYSDLIFNVVIGNSFNNVEEISKCHSNNIKFYENATAEQMKSVMIKSDIAITAAGQTIYELIATQTPFIPIKVVENQYHNIIALKNLHLVKTALEYNDPLFAEKLIREFEKLKEFSSRSKLTNKYNKVIDGLGSKRIIDALILGDPMEENYFLRKVKEEDIFDVFQLSNADYVRKYSINTKQINWEDHKTWFENILKTENQVFHVVTDPTDKFLGQLRYKIEEESATVSISLCKSITGKGLSRTLLNKSIKLLTEERKKLKDILAYISIENIASKKLFEKAGFILLEKNNGMLKYVYSIK